MDRDGLTVRERVCRVLGRCVPDAEIAAALGLSVSGYSRRKDRPDFPRCDELRRIAEQMGIEAVVLLVDFGHLHATGLSPENQQRYGAYRHAVAALAALRTQLTPPIRTGELTAVCSGHTPTSGPAARIGAKPTNQPGHRPQRIPTISQARARRAL